MSETRIPHPAPPSTIQSRSKVEGAKENSRRRHFAQSRSGELCDGERKRHSPPKYEGMLAREWHDIRSEFGPIFTF